MQLQHVMACQNDLFVRSATITAMPSAPPNMHGSQSQVIQGGDGGHIFGMGQTQAQWNNEFNQGFQHG
jgi:hypothetical protein